VVEKKFGSVLKNFEDQVREQQQELHWIGS
jgi:hypothetical protein